MIKKWISILLVIGLTVAVCGFILANDDQKADTVKSFKAPGVSVVCLKKEDYRLKISARGIVKAAEYTDIRSEIPGKIINVAAGVYPGAKVRKGDLLFALEDRQYRLQLQEARAACMAAQQAQLLEEGRQMVARRQWQMLASPKKYSDKEKQLALREPQLITCRAELEKAKVRRDLAQYDLDRTEITAPCNGVILSESVSKGMMIGPDTVALRLACNDTFHIIAKFSSQMVPDTSRPAALINIGKETCSGRVKSLLPGCDPETGQRAALVEFETGNTNVLNCYACVTLQGEAYSDVYVIDREAVRSGNTVWVLDEKDTLAIVPFTLLGRDQSHVVAKGLVPGTRLVLSHLSNPLAGMALQPLPSQNSESKTEN